MSGLVPCTQCGVWLKEAAMVAIPADLEERPLGRTLCPTCVHHTYGLTVEQARQRIKEAQQRQKGE